MIGNGVILGLLRQIETDVADLRQDACDINASLCRMEKMLDSMLETSASMIRTTKRTCAKLDQYTCSASR